MDREYREKMKAFVDARVEERKRDFEKKLTTDEGKRVLRDETERQKVLRSAREDKLKAMSKSARKEARIKEKFHHFDMDQSGFLDEEEFGLMLDSLCVPMGKEQRKDAFASIDVDGDGGIDWEEFLTWYKSDGKRAMKRMRLARLRMKSLKRMNSMLGFTDEERARRVLLASVVSRTRDEAKASYVKSNPPPLDKSNEKFLADMHIPSFVLSSKNVEEEEVIALRSVMFRQGVVRELRVV